MTPASANGRNGSVHVGTTVIATQQHYTGPPDGEKFLAKPNYSFEKRQREIAKKKQQDEKDARKREAREAAKPASEKAPE